MFDIINLQFIVFYFDREVKYIYKPLHKEESMQKGGSSRGPLISANPLPFIPVNEICVPPRPKVMPLPFSATDSSAVKRSKPSPQPFYTVCSDAAIQRMPEESEPQKSMFSFLNNTGIPTQMKREFEERSGLSFDDVRVHYNAEKPAQLQALAYTQGNQVYVGQGQEKHLRHELGHVVQQKQGRVRTTKQLQGVAVNDDPILEREADVIGLKVLNSTSNSKMLSDPKASRDIIQFVFYPNENALWTAVEPHTPLDTITEIIHGNIELRTAYQDSLTNLHKMYFINVMGTQPNASYDQNSNGSYDINYGWRETQSGAFKDEEKFIEAIIHEMGHVNSAIRYNTNVPSGVVFHFANMHLPILAGDVFHGTAVGINQRNNPAAGWEVQRQTMEANWNTIENLRSDDHGFSKTESEYLKGREDYAKGCTPEAHYDTVLIDVLYYLQYHRLNTTHYYLQATAMLREANLRRNAGQGVVAPVPLVPAPFHMFFMLYNNISTLLNNPRWSNQGKAIFFSERLQME